jgi:hypothetical protein
LRLYKLVYELLANYNGGLVLREVAGPHLLERNKHGLEGAKVLLLNHLLEEFRIALRKLSILRRDRINMDILLYKALDALYILLYVDETFLRGELEGAGLCFAYALVD